MGHHEIYLLSGFIENHRGPFESADKTVCVGVRVPTLSQRTRKNGPPLGVLVQIRASLHPTHGRIYKDQSYEGMRRASEYYERRCCAYQSWNRQNEYHENGTY